jgi:hypothetical protein
MRKSRMIAGGVASATAVAALGLGVSAQGAPNASSGMRAETDVSGRLLPLNNSGASGKASVSFTSRRDGVVRVRAHGLAPGLPHAQHIHFGRTARNECPTAVDAGDDHRLTTTDGAGAYGPVRTSLTTSGDTSPESVLAVDRYPVAPEGRVRYERDIRFTSKALARAIRDGKGVVVIHGVDYNGNGTYDFSSGKSDLDSSLPAEATDPAVCGVLH